MPSSFRAVGLFILALMAVASADRAFVANRGGTTVNVFDTSTNLEESTGSPITVGTTPIDMASDQLDTDIPSKIFVANSGSNNVSVIDSVNKVVVGTLDGSGGAFGTFVNPSGVCRAFSGTVGPSMVVVDEKTVSGTKSTIRFISPTTHAIQDELRDNGATARYVDVVFTANGSNRRLWIPDDGDNGVVVVRLDSMSGPPFPVGDVLIFTGGGEFADFIYDSAGTPTFLLNPQRIATNGTTRVVVADTSSDILTIINADYTGDSEGTAIVANVDLGLAAGMTAIDVEVAAGKAYVTTTDPLADVKVVNLTSLVVTTILLPTTVGGIGKTSDDSKIYVGAGTGLSAIYEIATATDTLTTTIVGFTGGAFPFAFQVNSTSNSSGGGGGGFGPDSTFDGGGSGGCGLLGLDALLALGLLGLLSRRRR